MNKHLKTKKKLKKALRKTGLTLLIIVGFIFQLFLVLFISVYIILESERIQIYLTGHLEEYLVEKTGTRIEVERVFIAFPKNVGISGLYVEDIDGNTLAELNNLKVNLRFRALLQKKIIINSITIDDLKSRIERPEQSDDFNYTFLIESFSQSDNNKKGNKQDDAADEPWGFDIGRIILNNIDLKYHDYEGGVLLDLTLEQFIISLNHFSFEKYGVFDIDQISLYDACIIADISEMIVSPDETIEETVLPDISLAKLDLENISFSMTGNMDMNIEAKLGDLLLLTNNINLNKQDFDINLLAMNNGTINYTPPNKSNNTFTHQNNINNNNTFIEDSNSNGLKLLANEISLNHINFSYNDSINLPGFYNGFDLQSINCNLNNTYFRNDSIYINASHISMRQHNGINIKDLKGIISAGKNLNAKDIELTTGESSLQADFEAGFDLLAAKNIAELNPEFKIHKFDGTFGSDIATMFPVIKDNFLALIADNPVTFGLKAQGKLDDLAMDTLWLTAGKYFTCRLRGNATNILSYARMNIDVDTLALMTAPNNIMSLAYFQLPQNITMPDFLLLKGKGNFTSDSLAYRLNGISNKGTFQSNGQLSGLVKNNLMTFSGDFDFNNLDLGYILNNDTLLGKTSGTIIAGGNWKDLENSDINFDVHIEDAILNNYNYKGLSTTGHLKDKEVSIDMLYSDENLDFDLDIYIDLLENTRVRVAGNLNRLFFRELHLLENNIRLEMNVDSDVILYDNNWVEGNIAFYDARVYKNMDLYMVDTLKALSWSEGNNKNINIKTNFLDAGFTGNVNPAEIPSLVLTQLNKYFSQETEPVNEKHVSTEGKNFRLWAELKPSKLITDVLYSKIEQYHSITLESYFDGDESELLIDLDCLHLMHEEISLKNINISFLSGYNSLDFFINFDEINYQSRIYKNFALEGSMVNKFLDFNLSFDDDVQKQILNINGTLHDQEPLWALSILPGNLVINYEKWQIDKNNKILFGDNDYSIEYFNLAYDEQAININTVKNDDESKTLKAGFIDFNLDNIAGILQEPGLVGGILNGKIEMYDFTGDMTFSSDIIIHNFTFSENKIGDIDIKTYSTKEKDYHLTANIKGYENEMQVHGIYSAESESPFDFEVNFPNIDIKSLEGFMHGELSDMEGSAGGEFLLKGSPESPELTGYITFNETSFTVDYLNTRILINKETFNFKNNYITFDNFRFSDEGGRVSTINGNIIFRSIYDIGYDLNISSQNFQFLNIPKGQNNSFYGRLMIDSDLNVHGDLGNPVIRGTLKLRQGSTFTYIVPHASAELAGREGVAEFWVPADTLLHTEMEAVIPETTHTVPFTNLDVSLNIDIDRTADLGIIMDEAAGDHLEVKGGGVISLGITPDGEMTLTGRYDVVEGMYQLTFYDFIRRRFEIRTGSSLLWTGNPMKAQMDVAAVYNTRAPIRDLIEPRISAGQEIEPRTLNQILPFNVIMQMKGDLEQPEISFQLDMPVEHRNALNGLVYSKIQEINQNESDLNKQVFSLLMFNKFISDDLLALFGTTSGTTAAARTSASRLMTQQLNRLSDRYIRNVDLTLEIESYQDYASSDLTGRTELQIELTKDFFDEKVFVTVGGNIEIEDHEARRTNPGNLAGDVSVEYLLLEDGSLRLKGYRKDEHADVFEGQITETGLSLIFRRNFNNLNDLFRRREKQEQITDDKYQGEQLNKK